MHQSDFGSFNRISKLSNLAGLALVCLILGLGNCFGQEVAASANQKQNPHLLEQLENRTDELRFEKLLETSTIEAEAFRRSLLTDSKRGALTLGVACGSFRDLDSVKRFSESSSYDLSRFRLSYLQISEAIAGTRNISDPVEFYGSFQGQWYGLWEQNKVNHHWGEYVKLKRPAAFEIKDEPPVRLMGYQYAWVGDGYGINHVAQSIDGQQKFLLGYVVHVRDESPEKEYLRRPHVGVIDGPGRLIWITKSEVFFEEMVKGETRVTDRYYITGFRYSIKNKKLTASQAFHAVYSRDAEHRKPWRGFEIEMTVAPPSK